MKNEISPANIDDESTRANLIGDLQTILESSNRELERRYRGTPFARARGFGLKRNALIVIENRNLHELSPAIEKYLAQQISPDNGDQKLTKLASLASEVLLKIRR